MSEKYSDRQIELLQMARDAFWELRSPFGTDSLDENNVTLDECAWLSREISEMMEFFIPARRDKNKG